MPVHNMRLVSDCRAAGAAAAASDMRDEATDDQAARTEQCWAKQSVGGLAKATHLRRFQQRAAGAARQAGVLLPQDAEHPVCGVNSNSSAN